MRPPLRHSLPAAAELSHVLATKRGLISGGLGSPSPAPARRLALPG